MAQIKLTPDELRTSATKYTSGAESINEVLSTLESEQATISENWDGSAFDSFDQQFEDLKPKITQFAELLQSINTQLVSVADTLEQTDADIASQIGG